MYQSVLVSVRAGLPLFGDRCPESVRKVLFKCNKCGLLATDLSQNVVY